MAKVDSEDIGKALDRVYQESRVERLEVGTARIVVFSDQHKGQGDKADDFRRSKQAYHAALGSYLTRGYTLFVLGDAEELWECQPKRVVRHYADTLELERRFHEAGRYVRFYGNHDDVWKHGGSVEEYLYPIFGPIQIHEGLRLEVQREGETLGTLFFVHGHQGTLSSDQRSDFSEFVVRVFWRNIQRVTGWRINTPAKDIRLQAEHDQAMYAWAKRQPRLALVVGHTHRPVFMSDTHLQSIRRRIAAFRETLGETLTGEQRAELAGLHAELEWVRARDMGESIDADTPCYFNSGCCCFDDGDITGLEIEGDAIRLVRWPDDADNAHPKELAKASLSDVLARS